MSPLNLAQILEATGGTAVKTVKTTFLKVGTDTRKNLTGHLFIALKGESFDAHQYLLKAQAQGADAVLVDHIPDSQKEILNLCTVIQVPDTLLALQNLGTWVRKKNPAKILAMTGSNGKTSTKEFTAQILGSHFKVHYSQGSFNNHWGVPFSLLDLQPEHQVAVIEMGMNHSGEIQRLVEIAQPDAVVCTMVGRAHIEFFGTQEKIAAAKEEIYIHSNPKSMGIFNLDNPWTALMLKNDTLKNPQRPRLTFSEKEKADVQVKLLEVSFEGLQLQGHIQGVSGEAFVPIFGEHNLTNLLAAASLSLAAGLSPQNIWQGLQNCKSHWGRNQKVKLKSGAVALFDAYNANPDSMDALLNNVKSIRAKRKIGVFGQMKELGDLSSRLHQELGEKVGSAGFERVFFYGEDVESFRTGLKNSQFSGEFFLQDDFASHLADQLSGDLRSGDFLVFKASRSLKLERMLLACSPLDFLDK
jgi:UDP-N-acetylmuramoyl-tripeptide--D-alanyl-D-alanine ligase